MRAPFGNETRTDLMLRIFGGIIIHFEIK